MGFVANKKEENYGLFLELESKCFFLPTDIYHSLLNIFKEIYFQQSELFGLPWALLTSCCWRCFCPGETSTGQECDKGNSAIKGENGQSSLK